MRDLNSLAPEKGSVLSFQPAHVSITHRRDASGAMLRGPHASAHARGCSQRALAAARSGAETAGRDGAPANGTGRRNSTADDASSAEKTAMRSRRWALRTASSPGMLMDVRLRADGQPPASAPGCRRGQKKATPGPKPFGGRGRNRRLAPVGPAENPKRPPLPFRGAWRHHEQCRCRS